MPTISVKRDSLFKALGKTYTDDEFQDLCFQFGLELDEVTTEKQMLIKEQGEKAGAGTSEEILYRIDIPANRYDLLCLEGLVNGLLVFLGKMDPPMFTKSTPTEKCSVHITTNTAQIRPYVVAAVLRNITFTQESFNSFIDLQDKLHQNICRKRTLVAIGTHDLDTLEGPFLYDALPPKQIVFKALNQTKEMSAVELMELYKTHPQLKQFLGIIENSPVYPVIKDSNGVILSLPPIINGEHSKITLNTKNVFIECTATDLKKATVVLDTMVCMFSKYCATPFVVEECKVYRPDGMHEKYPALKYYSMKVDMQEVKELLGNQIMPSKAAELVNRMGLKASLDRDERLTVTIPPTRHDIIHLVDVIEDIGIAYGYNNIDVHSSRFRPTEGRQLPRNKLVEQLRQEMAHVGYTEALTFTLCSRDDVSTKLGRPLSTVPAVHISNPKTAEFQVVRTTLLPGLLKTLAANKRMPLPINLFEISDVVLKTEDGENAYNQLRLCAGTCARVACFQNLHGVLDRIAAKLRVPRDPKEGYTLEPADDPAYFPGRCANVLYKGKSIGQIGVLHPSVLAGFELTNPCTVLEINLEPFI